MAMAGTTALRRGPLAAAALLVLAPAQGPAAVASRELQAVLDATPAGEDIAVIAFYAPSYRPPRFRKAVADAEFETASLQQAARGVRRRQLLHALQSAAADDAAPIIAAAETAGATGIHNLWMGQGVALHARREFIWRLLADPQVLEVRLDAVLTPALSIAAAPSAPGWNISALGVPGLWGQGVLGDGAVLALLDTGADLTHPDLATGYRGGTNSWYDPYGQHAAPHDADGHGTQVLGLAVGGSAGGSAIGVAPNARWIAARIFDDAHVATASAIHLAYQWVIDPDGNPATDDAPDVVVNSWDIASENTCQSQFQADIDALRAADIAVVYSAGNFGPNPATSVSPANNARVTSVGSVGQDGLVSFFSSRGPSTCDGSLFPKVVAPGDLVHTSDLALAGVGQYVDVSGTSFAAPEVAGAIALLRAALPAASAAETEAAIAATARDIDVPGPDNNSGYGLVDAGAAYVMLSHPTDNDGDGYSVNTDCNDHDPGVHPGAAERIRDGVDQDCNGYDQTIDVKYAVYSHDGSKLKLRATTALGERAQLQLVGTGALTWRAVRGDWIYDGAAPAGAPAVITLKGAEGEVSLSPRPPTPTR